MTAATPEFSRPLTVDRVPRGGSYEKIAAGPAECMALAKRLDVAAIHALGAEMRATPWRGGGLKLEGALKADVEQVSVVSLEAFRHVVEYPVLRYFMPPGAEALADDADFDIIAAGLVDLGEVVAETLALELDPYPRRPGEAFAGEPGTASKPPVTASPFAALLKLKPK
jgi:uncharacterized metal-binding protein YceD (DUF177 family)